MFEKIFKFAMSQNRLVKLSIILFFILALYLIFSWILIFFSEIASDPSIIIIGFSSLLVVTFIFLKPFFFSIIKIIIELIVKMVSNLTKFLLEK